MANKGTGNCNTLFLSTGDERGAVSYICIKTLVTVSRIVKADFVNV